MLRNIQVGKTIMAILFLCDTLYKYGRFRMTLAVKNTGISYPNKESRFALSNPINCKSNTENTLEREPVSDTFENESSKESSGEKHTNGSKITLGIAGAIVATVATGICLMKRRADKIAKLYKEKLIKRSLPEHIDFKEAKTLEEGIKFAKEVLGIKEVKGFEGFDKEGAIEAINFANKGLVDVSNANKGNLYIPTALSLEKIEKSTLAYEVLDINSSRFGQLGINKKYFTHDGLDSILKKRYGLVKDKDIDKTIIEDAEKSVERDINFGIKWSDRYKDLLSRYKADPTKLTIAEKRELDRTFSATANVWSNATTYNPIATLEQKVDLFKRQGIIYDLEALYKLPIDEQIKKFDELCLEFFNKTKTVPEIESASYIPCQTIYHEMGHLQDFGKNLKELHIKNTTWGRVKETFLKGEKQDKCLDNINNRWAKKEDKYIKQLLKDSHDDFKKYYPDLYEHITNADIQKTAGKVSSYAREGVGEFIAETYAGLVAGEKYSDDVMKLYEKYNGPKLIGK